jgi:hypothetical protein
MMVRAVICAALTVGGSPAAAAPPEPLVVMRLADPDPSFVPPPEPARRGQKSVSSDQDPTLDDAMQDFGRAIGQATMLQRQQIEARCQAGEAANANAEQRFAWQASCRYTRH